MKLPRCVVPLLALAITFTTTSLAADEALSVRAIGGIHATLFIPRPDELEYIGIDASEQDRYGLWPTVGIEVAGLRLGDLQVGGGVGIQPMFLARIVRSQLNPDDTFHTDLDLSLYTTVFMEYPLGKELTLIAGPVGRLSYWSYDYLFDSQIGPDTANFYSGTYFAWGLMAGVAMPLSITDRLTIPISVRAYPTFAYGLMMPVAVLAGIQITTF